jgi:hypothetical protein
VRLSWDDLLIIAAATQRPRELARLVAGAVVEDHEFDVQLHRDGRSYIILLRVVAGERIVTETEWPVAWSMLEERTRYQVLGLYAGQLVASADRTTRRAERALASIPRVTRRR